ncbi:MAG: AmmeMemoRadiSam system radical SAM enzyme [Acidobacteria bacterium RIFCSPLOWO2_02_FULL_68_18]|nr:MAG: AmmeMemoRadiSam system radical SAM enzyme [Acidobacteria bacterium RIFCSPLOWO2_02_FULL_68_18]OFW49123.1 MAG: AmmeMemoRadiSam system radical SAM enzyme [Acidobacteria bacterium RIFCSPLOWO2_12_FULL_68_19]
MPTLEQLLAARTGPAAPELVEPIEKGRVRCYACGHQCPIPEGARGVCKVRYNEGGRLHVPWGYVGGVQCDPVEKKPFFHAHPGSLAYSFGMLGCDLHCSYCQNWVTSQALRDPQAVAPLRDVTPAALVRNALDHGARIVVSTYNEPLISAEWAVEIFREARAHGLVTGFVSNGNGTPRVLEYLRPYIDLYKVDLKSFDDKHYRELGGRLQPILDTIAWLHRHDVWVEIVTLLVPGFNDSDAELVGLAEFVAGVSVDIPWHVTAFHQDYRMTDPPDTTPGMLQRAARIGRDAGLRYVYAGNAPGRVGDLEHTHCHGCGERLVTRCGYLIEDYRLTPAGTCPGCATPIPGRWSARFERQRTAFPFLPRHGTPLSAI